MPARRAGYASTTSRRAERLREIVRGKRDAALRQVEAESIAHGAAEPGIRTRVGRPHSLYQASEHDAVGALQPRFQGTEDAYLHAAGLRPAHHPLPDRQLEQLGIVRGKDFEVGVRSYRCNIEKGFIQLDAVMVAQCRGLAGFRPAQGRDDGLMPLRKLAERHRRGRQRFERRQRGAEIRQQLVGTIEIRVGQVGARVRPMQLGCFLAPKLGELVAESRERALEPCGAGAGTRAAQRRLLQGGNGPAELALRSAEPHQGMFEERQKAHGRQSSKRRLGGEAGEAPGGSRGESIAAGIVGRDVPAAECRKHAAGKRAIGGDQGRRLLFLDRLAQCDRNRERLLLGICRLDEAQRVDRGPQRNIRMRELLPALGCGRRSQRFRDGSLASRSAPGAKDADLIAADADAPEQTMHGELRMPGGGRDAIAAGPVGCAHR